MKKYTHAWLALKATQLLKSYQGKFNAERNQRLKRLLKFLSPHPSTFVRGAWFPDTKIKDNCQGGHTWKYYLDPTNGRGERRRPPEHNRCLSFVQGNLHRKISLDKRTSDLPDRCEALGQMIRDSTLITNKIGRGDMLIFNDSQIALFYLMLAHYISDAHVPVHCDKRDFYKPSHVHPDLEKFWEDEVKKHYQISTKREQFDLDEDGNLQRKTAQSSYEQSILYKCDVILEQLEWQNMDTEDTNWNSLLGSGNNNFWDYLVSVCLVSFNMSLLLFSLDPPAGIDYNTVRIMDDPNFEPKVIEYSPDILADAVSSVALLWLAAWERWELLKQGIR